MGHYLIKRYEQHPDTITISHLVLHGPVTAPSPEEAIRKKNISTVPIVIRRGSVEITVYELADDGEGNATVYQMDDLELDNDYPNI